MTANPEGPAPVDRPRSNRVTELALAGAGLGLVVYFFGFVDGVNLGIAAGPLLVGGGLLAGTVALPAARARVLVPAAVATVTGALFLLQATVAGNDAAVAVTALVVALVEAAAVTVAALMQTGAVRPPRPRVPAGAHPGPQHAGQQYLAPPAPGQQYAGQQYPEPQYPESQYPEPQHPESRYPGQQQPGRPYPPPYPGQPYPGAYPAGAGQPAGPYAVGGPADRPAAPYPGDQYAGEHAYAQNARYGGQYGVPGYPPPPMHGAPGPDPAGRPTAYDPARRDAPDAGAPGDAATTVVARPEPASSAPTSDDAARTDDRSGAHRAWPPRTDDGDRDVPPSAEPTGGPADRDRDHRER